MIKILVIDDDKLVAASLKTILSQSEDIEVIALGHSGQEAIELYHQHLVDVILMDIRMENMNGLDAGTKILGEDSEAKILYLTTFLDDEYIVKALRIGAKGYLLKQNFDSILPAIRAVAAGQRVFGEAVVDKLPKLLQQKSPSTFSDLGLSDKEIQILTCVADGLSNKEIGAELFLSEGTVRNYISVILERLNLRDRTQLAIFYYRNQ
jgi:DNA-binding NarL/FixJ family response regulator